MNRRWAALWIGGMILLGLGFAAWLIWGSFDLSRNFDAVALGRSVEAAGIWGPILTVGLMTVAVVFSPLPSAPIALAAGAVYGHVWGTFYVIIGAEVGAVSAFAIARLLGYDLMRRWFGDKLDMGLLGSQNALMATVFVTRLIPFVSFDIVSYAAGLTCLAPWRFALATLAGIVPASFLLAHFGGELTSSEPGQITWAVLALGGITGIPLLIVAMRKRWRRAPNV